MPPKTASIQTLPTDVAAQLKSSVTIASLNFVVLGLVTNSLEAGASNIDVVIDYSRGTCIVEDDGCGIAHAEFEASGGLCKPFRKFKTIPLNRD